MRELAWVLQALILTAGIHLFLRFVRTTRGIRLIRGLFVTVLVGDARVIDREEFADDDVGRVRWFFFVVF